MKKSTEILILFAWIVLAAACGSGGTDASEPEPGAPEPSAEESGPAPTDGTTGATPGGRGGYSQPPSAAGTGGRGDSYDAPPPASSNPLIEHMGVRVDMNEIRLSPIYDWMLEQVTAAAEPETQMCLVKLLGRVESFSFDAGEEDPDSFESILFEATGDLSEEDALGCLRGVLEPETLPVERDIAGARAWRFEEGDPTDRLPVLAHAPDGRWLLGSEAEVASAVLGGAETMADPELQEILGTLGPVGFRLGVIPGPSLGDAFGSGGSGPMACLGELLRSTTAMAFGAHFGGSLDVTATFQTTSGARATDGRRCLSDLWAIGGAAAFSMLDPGTINALQDALGMSIIEFVGSVRFEAVGDAVRIQVSIPASAAAMLLRFMADATWGLAPQARMK